MLYSSAAEILELYQNPNVRKIFSPSFYKKDRKEQEELIKGVPQFAKKGVNIDTILDTSRNYYFFSVDFLSNELADHVHNRVITKQDEDGGFPLVDRDYLLEIRGKEFEEAIDNYLKSYKDTFNKVYQRDVQDFKQVLVPTYWTNYIVLLLLSKWKTCVEQDSHPSISYPLDKIVSAIKKGKEWLEDNSLDSGFPFSHKSISNTPNTYDTCMALIALNYTTSYDNDIQDGGFSGKEHLEALLRTDIRNANGSWKKEPGIDKEDTGATAYATQTLLKYYRRENDDKERDRYLPFIENGVKWLIDNQRKKEDGGWGEFGQQQSQESFVEKTCYALMALAKYQTTFFKYSVTEEPIDAGLSFLNERKRPYKPYSIGFVWPNDYEMGKAPEEWKDSLKNSSLAISAMLRCGVKGHDVVVQKGIIGTSRFYEKTHEENSNAWYNPIYYFCMLADFLKRVQ
ncbi:MAG: terpene cyclase/mutase family protein [Deltaproteobacteria bacterium]|nr:terpene cyclase/mutase family protein [Deltaproteobacteria bacterium]